MVTDKLCQFILHVRRLHPRHQRWRPLAALSCRYPLNIRCPWAELVRRWCLRALAALADVRFKGPIPDLGP
jgi:hypothetical protein